MLSERDEHDLLTAMSILRRVLAANGTIQHDPVRSAIRTSQEMTPYEGAKEIPPEPEPLELDRTPSEDNSDADSQADGIKDSRSC